MRTIWLSLALFGCSVSSGAPIYVAKETCDRPVAKLTGKVLSVSDDDTVAVIGDSWSATSYYWLDAFYLRAAVASGAQVPGWVSLAFSQTGAIAGAAGSNVTVTKGGQWSSQYLRSATVDGGSSSTSVSGSWFAISGTGPISDATIMASGVFSTRWNNEKWRPQNIASMMSSPISLPTGNGSWTLTIRADGPMMIAGVDLHRKHGLRINKLAKNGATSTDWASIDHDRFVLGLKALRSTRYIIFLGTNDQWLGGQVSIPADVFGANLAIIINRIREATPKADILIVSPPMVRTEGLPRALYAEQARSVAARARISQLDLQCAFGSNLADYRFGSRSPLLDKTSIHPSIPGGRDAILTGLSLAMAFD